MDEPLGDGRSRRNLEVWTDPALWEKLKPLAREKRSKPTEAERLLWHYLRRHKLHGFKFRRQHNVERFIVDFYCAEAHLVVEIDGPIHQYQMEEDRIRQEFLEKLELKILRFSNDDVLNNQEKTIAKISTCLIDLTSSPPLH